MLYVRVLLLLMEGVEIEGGFRIWYGRLRFSMGSLQYVWVDVKWNGMKMNFIRSQSVDECEVSDVQFFSTVE